MIAERGRAGENERIRRTQIAERDAGEEWVLVKEKAVARRPLRLRWLALALAAALGALLAGAALDDALPEALPRDAPPDKFSGERAREHLLALTALGPRVAGSYESDVLALGLVADAARRLAADATHNALDVHAHSASGAFALDFLDGLNSVYRDVRGVVARVRGAGGRAGARGALLFNCHVDTVPDSAGASDDAAGCAVLLEVLRALAARRSPLARDALFLFNGAEENIMQGSHAFVTTHPWARSALAFVNVEACGAGGREVLFQAGPRAPALVAAYARAAPRPFASSLAQELFESGALPADTDYRVFRDFGRLPGFDFAWASGGHAYHTRLDAAERVPAAALQRTGDNVLALALDLLEGGSLAAAAERAPQPVYFDALGRWCACVRAEWALAAAAAALLLVAAAAGGARARALRAAGVRALAAGAGVAAAAAAAAALQAAGAPLAYYSRPWLLLPLFAAPALGTAWAVVLRAERGGGWEAARAQRAAGRLVAGALLAGAAAARLRSGFVPLLWAAPPAAAELLLPRRASPALRAALVAASHAPAALQTCYAGVAALRTLVPIAGRAGARALGADVPLAALVGALALLACSWAPPLLVVSRRAARLPRAALVAFAAAAAAALLAPPPAPYSAEAPARLMVLHARRSRHEADGRVAVDAAFWVPELDALTARTVRAVRELAGARAPDAARCARDVYCGAPYVLPAVGLVPRSLEAPAPEPAAPRLRARMSLVRANATSALLEVRAEGAAGARLVLALAAGEGARVAWSDAVAAPAEGARWRGRRTYFFLVHRGGAGAGAAWALRALLTHAEGAAPSPLADAALAAHALWGPKGAALDALLAALPPWVAATAWPVDVHLLTL